MDVAPDPRHIESIQAANVAIGGTQVVINDNELVTPQSSLESEFTQKAGCSIR